MKRSLLLLTLIILLSTLASFASAQTTIYAPAVDSNGNGVLTTMTITATPGTGRIRTDVQRSLVSTDTEESIRNSAAAAAKLLGVSLSSYDINVDIEVNANIIDGPSGGIALGLGIYDEMAKLVRPSTPQLRKDFTVTGTLDTNGRTGFVGGVDQKVLAASKKGIKLMIIASGQSANDGLDYVVYAKEVSNGSLQLIEVPDLQTAISLVYTPNGSFIPGQKEFVITPLTLDQFPSTFKSSTLKLIAQQEVDYVRGLLNDEANQGAESGVESVVIRSVNTSLDNAQKMINAGYIYSAANTAFLARINLETNLNQDTTSDQFKQAVREFTDSLNDFDMGNATKENYEMLAGARLRYWWAKVKINEVNQDLSNGQLSASTMRDYFTARAWMAAATKLRRALVETPATPVNEQNLREYALDLYDQAEQIANQSTDTEIQWHYKTGKEEIANEDYLSATYDLQFVLTGQATADQLDGKTPAELVAELNNTKLDNIYPGDHDSSWGEMYYAHAIYNLQESKRLDEPSLLVSFVRLRELAAGFADNSNEALQEFQSPRPAGNHSAEFPNPSEIFGTPLSTGSGTGSIGSTTRGKNGKPLVSAVITQQTPDYFGVVAIVTGLLVVFLILCAIALSSGSYSSVNRHNIIDKLDEALLAGRISERTYRELKGKYSKSPTNTDKKEATTPVGSSAKLKQKRTPGKPISPRKKSF